MSRQVLQTSRVMDALVEADLNALRCLYEATNGDNWRLILKQWFPPGSFLESPLQKQKKVHFFPLKKGKVIGTGLKIADNNVVRLELYDRALKGTLPATGLKLSSLQVCLIIKCPPT